MTIRATYRIQLHKGFTFADAEAQVPYLADLGISHLYASPITTAQPGSMHGYDVIDPTRVNPELGGENGFRSLVATLRKHGMGVILDIVPNHMCVASDDNRWWRDVLANGPESEYARYFDIDWSAKLLLPFLGSPLGEAIVNGDLALERSEEGLVVRAYGAQSYPVRSEDRDADPHTDLTALLERQHYRLAWWRSANDELNWRRFFTITELAGVRVEDDAVFEATHALYFRLYAEGLVDGFRIDHVDGLSDPAGYCRKLRARLEGLRAGRAYIVVEKILGAGEPLPPDWNVDGTSGYDFMEQVSALLHAPEGQAALDAEWADWSGRPASFALEELAARQDMLAWEFEGQLAACVRAFARLADSDESTGALTVGMLRRALTVLLWVFPVYRTYGTGTDAPETDARTRELAREGAAALAPPGELSVVDQILVWLAGTGPGDPSLAVEAVRRFQQLSAPIAAKAVEDTAFYRYGRLLSRNDVGFDPGRFSMPTSEFHSAMSARRKRLPRSMLATATHDHKRGEDTRARLAVLSEVPELWLGTVHKWRSMNGAEQSGIAAGDEYQLYQTFLGAWPPDLSPDSRDALATFRDRILFWQDKALREAKLRSSWTEPNEAYERRNREFIERLLDPAQSRDFLQGLAALEQRLRPAANANSLLQALLRNTVPGMPDLYQGSEYRDLSLVDPDNRREVDFVARQHSLAGAAGLNGTKQELIARLLRMRREQPALCEQGSYEPIAVEGPRAGNAVAFYRRYRERTLFAAGVLRCAPVLVETNADVPPSDWWTGTRMLLPDAPAMEAAVLFADEPVHASLR